MMLLRHGHLIAKGWWGPYRENDPHMLFSLSKSFTSTAVGLAVSEGLLSVDDLVLPYFPDEVPVEISDNLAAMRIRHLLSMSTGHAEDTMQHLRDQPDENWARAFLAQPVVYKPGTHFLYNSGASYMLSAIVQQLTGETVLDYLTPRLFEPLGIESPTWESCPRGINVGGWGLKIKTEDIARFGQLCLQRGEWQGKRLLSESWVETATAFHVSNAGSGMGESVDDAVNDWAQGYGYQFWRCRHNVYRGDGAFGQFCIVMPDQDAVIAVTAGVENMQAVLDQVWTHLLPALGPMRLVEDPGSVERLERKLGSLVLPTPMGDDLSPVAATVSGQTYRFDENEQGITAISFEFEDGRCTLTRWRGDDEIQVAAVTGAWQTGGTVSESGIASPVAVAGAWTAEDVYEVVVCFQETPFCQTFTCGFDGDRLLLDECVNVSFGPTERPQIVGRIT